MPADSEMYGTGLGASGKFESKTEDVFEGKALIDRLLVYFSKFEGSREKACKYAQKLLDLGHIECVTKSSTFKDSELQYQWSDVASVMNKAKSKTAENAVRTNTCVEGAKVVANEQRKERKPVVRISIEADNCEGTEIRAHIRASPVTNPNINNATQDSTNNGEKFCLAEVQNGKMISFMTETSTTEEVLRMLPVSATVKKYESLMESDSNAFKETVLKKASSGQEVKKGQCGYKGNQYQNGQQESFSNNSDNDNAIEDDKFTPTKIKSTITTSASPGKGETSSNIPHCTEERSVEVVKSPKSEAQSNTKTELIQPQRSNSEPIIPKNKYEFSEEKYLQEVKSKPIPTISSNQDKTIPTATSLVVSNDVKLPKEPVASRSSKHTSRPEPSIREKESGSERSDFSDDIAWQKMRKEYLENEEIREATQYSSGEQQVVLFDCLDASLLHSSCLHETIEEEPEPEEDGEIQNLVNSPSKHSGIGKMLLAPPIQPVIAVSPPPPSPPTSTKANDGGMKSLFWTKISCKSERPDSVDGSFWLNTDASVAFDQEEFAKLFSKPVTSPLQKNTRRRITQEEFTPGSKTLKVLGTERSRQIGIRASSIRIQTEDIHDAIVNMDDSELDLDSLEALYDVRPTSDELDDIADALKKYPEGILDKPEQFVLMMAMIGNLDERLKSWIFVKKFPDRILDLKEQLKVLSNVCIQIVQNSTLQRLFEATLTFGNYMNKGTQRGDADGFHLDILPKLKDVKSQGGDTNLMLYLVRWLISEKENQNKTADLMQTKGSRQSSLTQDEEEDDSGLPSHISIVKACSTSLQDIQEGIESISSELNECKEQLVPAVIEGGTCLLEIKPFSERMKDFIEQAEKALSELKDISEETVAVADDFRRYYVPLNDVQSESCTNMLKNVCGFCEDFRFYWDEEKRNVAKEAFFNTEKARRQRLAAARIPPK